MIGSSQQLRKRVQGQIRLDEPMSAHTTWRIGGPAEILFIPTSWEDVIEAVNWAKEESIPYQVIGQGSNLLVSDNGIKGLVIKTATGLKKLAFHDETIVVGAGYSLPRLAQEAANASLTGLEFAAGIPGTVGGAVVMNAGAFGGSMEKVVKRVLVVDSGGGVEQISNHQLGYKYRSSKLKNSKKIVVEVELKLTKGFKDDIKSLMEQNIHLRNRKQPICQPNAGSVFKNPPNDSAGRLIEAIGAKGWQVGDAQISHKHANFIVNLGQAKASDVLELINRIQNEVYDKFEIKLEPEVLYLGFN